MKVPVYRAGEAPSRAYSIERKTKETQIAVNLCLDGGEVRVSTGIGFFDHMLTALAFYAGWGLELEVEGDLHVDGHHTVEDTGIVLGQALKQALGEKTGIRRFGAAFVPMDEALCFTALDFSNRPFLVFDAEIMRALAMNGGLTLHQKCHYGSNAHHITEGLFKSLGLAVKEAIRVEGDQVVSTKGLL